MKFSRIAFASVVAAATVTMTACQVGGPMAGSGGAAATSGQAGSTQAAGGNNTVTTGGNNGNANAGGPGGGIPQLPAGLPDLSGISFGGGSLPAGFPLPPGAGNVRAVSAAGNVAAQLQVSDPTSAYNFWLSALPSAGYPVGQHAITTVNGVVTAGINLSGHGFQPVSAIAITGTTVTIGLQGGGDSGNTGGSGGSGNTGSGNGGGNAGIGAPITIENPSVTQTIACTGGPVTIQGPSDDITLTGSCGTLTVTGPSDHVVADSATSVSESGTNDYVTVHQGNPPVSKTGLNDAFQIG